MIDLERVEAESKQNISKIEELDYCLFDLSSEIAGRRHVSPNTRVFSITDSDNPEQVVVFQSDSHCFPWESD